MRLVSKDPLNRDSHVISVSLQRTLEPRVECRLLYSSPGGGYEAGSNSGLQAS